LGEKFVFKYNLLFRKNFYSNNLKIKKMDKDQQLLEKFKKENPWGLYVSVDLKQCNPSIIRSKEKIKEFVNELCKQIDMKKFGKTIVIDFGKDPIVSGFSMTQLIETSLISGHFAKNLNAAYIDIFSCKEFPPYKTAEFCKNFFGAQEIKINIIFRY
jgi:S-adenosylmethionine/arginine decarboxylase-like enzyme